MKQRYDPKMNGEVMSDLEKYFQKFKKNIVGFDFEHGFAGGKRQIIYADWAASGRLYQPIETYMTNALGPYVANTHTETTLTGTVMTQAYHEAHDIIKQHVNAGPDDRLLFAGFGMTAVVNKFQRILGLHVPEQYRPQLMPTGNERPLVIITHMEHHSNQTTWVECLCDLAIIQRDSAGLPDLNHLHEILQQNKDRKLIIGSFTACSNVTGIITPCHEMAKIIHEFGGYCFIDFSASAPYVKIDMHPPQKNQHLDAIFFSPHKFLGGPGSSGVIVFNKDLYHNAVPDHPGGGTVLWTNPWGEHHFFEDIEIREDGGTPGFLQGIRASLAILLKEEMEVKQMLEREHELVTRLMTGLAQIPELNIFEHQQMNRIGFVSFAMHGVHHNLIVRLLNDRFGIQTRGGCSCAGTYGHFLFNIDYEKSKKLTRQIDLGDLSAKPGWVRVSIHPTMTDAEIDFIVEAIKAISANYQEWAQDYLFNIHTGDFEALTENNFKIGLRETFSTVNRNTYR